MTWRDRLLASIAFRLPLALSFLLVALLVRELLLGLVRALIELPEGPPPVWLGPPGRGGDFAAALYAAIAAALSLALGTVAYRGYVRAVEKRRADELGLHRLLPELSGGVMLGGAFVVLMALPMWLGGWYRVVGWGTGSAVAIATFLAVSAAFMEELLVRGVLLRLLEQRVGTWIALATTSLIFGALHLGNPHASWWSALNIALSAGLVLGLAFVFTRRLWLAIGIHFGFNFFEGAVLGLGVSGSDGSGLIDAEVDGPTLVTGGEFGPEASLQTLVIGLILASGLGWMARHRLQRPRRVDRPPSDDSLEEE